MTPLRALVAAVLAERWARLPTDPDDEFHWAAPRRGDGAGVAYYVSTRGRVLWVSDRGAGLKARRLDRPVGGRKRPHWRVNIYRPAATAQPRDAAGRWVARATPPPAHYVPVRVCRLVLATFAGPSSPHEPLGRHGPGGSLDDSLRNLVRGTASSNLRDAWSRGERIAAGAVPF